ncbi:MAG: Zn2+/Cd2+-exporting ATPase [Halanaerobiales bacterium]|nr:Zn2+/Cd2+-exporting ATPase [Halanaerobiales bacterium]
MAENTLIQELVKENYILEGLNCSSCAAKIEEAVNNLSYVEEAVLNFATSKITITGDKETVANIDDELQKISDRIEPGIKVKKDKVHENAAGEGNSYLWRLGIGATLFILALVFYELPAFAGHFPFWLKIGLYGVSYVLIGGPVVMAAIRNIGRGQVFDENFLMIVATIGAFAIQEFPEGVAVMLFYMIGELFQDKAVDRSRHSIKNLMDIRPDYANLKQGDEINRVSPNAVGIGDLVVVKPGEKVPLDGEVIEGKAMVDTSTLTGESVPRKVETGDKILSGMINKDGLLTIRVTKEYGQSTVSKILDLVENASAKKAPTEQFITKFARYYTPVVVYAALAMAIIPSLVIPGATFSDWVYRALIFLVISCPCALVVSIPLGFFGGIGRASRQGILVKGGNYLEGLNQVKRVVFDKTGTLTKGVFKVSKVEAYNGYDRDTVLKMAALAEVHSNHPIAKSILQAYDAEINEDEIESYQEISGQGIKARVAGKDILAGNYKLLEREGVQFTAVDKEETIVYIVIDGNYAGYITITDEIKADAVRAIKGLKEIGIKELIMLTGDRESVAERVATKLGLDKYYAELLPDQKVEKVEELLATTTEGDKLAFVGDGINDAPVLARSDIGVAMGGLGSDAAIEAADVVLMTDEPSKLVTAIKIARKTRRIIWQNIIFALGTKGIVLMMGAFGIATIWEAVFADVGVALLAVLNAMRIIGQKETVLRNN